MQCKTKFKHRYYPFDVRSRGGLFYVNQATCWSQCAPDAKAYFTVTDTHSAPQDSEICTQVALCRVFFFFFFWKLTNFTHIIQGYLSGISLRWRQNGRDSVSNHQPHDCLLNRLFICRSKKTSKLRVTGLCAGNSPGTGEFPAQMASYADYVSIGWRHHVDHHRIVPVAYMLFDQTDL